MNNLMLSVCIFGLFLQNNVHSEYIGKKIFDASYRQTFLVDIPKQFQNYVRYNYLRDQTIQKIIFSGYYIYSIVNTKSIKITIRL